MRRAASWGLTRLRTACRKIRETHRGYRGIDRGSIREVLEAGAHSAAVVSTLMRERNLAARMEQLLRVAGAYCGGLGGLRNLHENQREQAASTSSTVIGTRFPRIRYPASVTRTSSSTRMPPKSRYVSSTW